MLGSATTDQELAQLLPEFVRHRLLVHEGEIQRLTDGTPIDIGSLAAARNFTGATLVVSISMRLALQLLKLSSKPTLTY